MIVEDWERVLILLNLERVVDGATFNNLSVVIVCFLIVFGGLLEMDIVNKVVCFGVDGVTIFQGLKTGVTIQLMAKDSLYIVGIHCMAHRCNLAVQIFSSLTLIGKIESLLASMYLYYNQSPKRHFECTRLAKVIESRGLNFLKNIKTRWIFMLVPFKWVFREYNNE